MYKYLKKEYLKQFIENGTVLVRTIYWYRDCENKKIKDIFEGRTKYTIENQQEYVTLSVEQVNAITNDYSITASLRVAPNSRFSDFLNVPNAFAFCTSLHYDRELMKKFDCDGFYKIVDLQNFANKISEELNLKYPLFFKVANKVNYVASKEIRITNENKDSVIRTDPYNKSKSDRIKTIYIEDYFTKPIAFKEEVEFRLIFIPKKPIGKDAVMHINCKKLVEYCEFSDS